MNQWAMVVDGGTGDEEEYTGASIDEEEYTTPLLLQPPPIPLCRHTVHGYKAA